ncbi:hypothetical protein Calkro_1819 [Caldicellulosiruptor kronotskyensis 2002]|uniref:Uncharacterized protein n=1 Tax=Caldicellulosiruptor kronotskyensis (strain DSM 18902 / VKM B-2412 / 2002) TaxID=632348 RepID=E4SFZ0_CALK2|nr:ECF transporter S component [Caldicellulosiruptor kronotskyensis]ADQ46665.1 hypothetical protein Calkro_1819 [Caldicellulosiruptor kronotskyensis 2002]
MSTRKITYAGMMVALTIIFLIFASILPRANSIFYILCSVSIMIIVWLFGIKEGFIVYIASSLLGVFLIPNKFVAMVYILIFGLYPIIKALCERGFPIYIEFFLKFLYYNLALIILYFMFKLIIRELPHFKFGMLLTVVSSEVIFILYDYLLTLILQKLKSFKIFGGTTHG